MGHMRRASGWILLGMIVAGVLSAVVSLAQGAPSTEPMKLSAIESFIAGHPAVVVWIWGAVMSLLTLLVGVITTLGARALRTIDKQSEEFRRDLTAGIENHARDVRELYATISRQSQSLDEKWEKLFHELQIQGKALAQLQGEHSILASHHFHALRRKDDPVNKNSDDNGGD